MKRRRSSSVGSDAVRTSGSHFQRSSLDDAGRDELLCSLAQAAEGNKPEEIETLAATDGLHLSAPWGDDGLTALHRATLGGSIAALRTLLNAGADTDAVETAGGRTALHFAALTSDFEAAKALVLAGADTELLDRDGRTPLHLSIIVPPSHPSHPSLPLYLLEVGAAGCTPDAFGMTPLDIAVRHGDADAVRGIFRETGGAPSPCPANRGLLYEAVRGGDARIVGALVGAGWEAGVPPPPPATEEGATSQETARGGGCCGPAAPHAGSSAASSSAESACGAGAVDSSPAPLASTAPAPAGGGETLSPLMLAADSGRPSVVKAILRGPNRGFPNAADARGYTALHFATMRGSVSIAEALLGLGSEPEGDFGGGGGGSSSASGNDGAGDACGGRTAASAAADFADPDLVNADGDTALHVAIATRRVEVAELLLRVGASARVANRLGFTALHFVAALGLPGLARRLLKKGADAAAVAGAASATAVSPGSSPRLGRRSGARAPAGGDGGAGERRGSEKQRTSSPGCVDGAKTGIGSVGTGDDGGAGMLALATQKLERSRTSLRFCPEASSSPTSSPRSSPKASPRSGPTSSPKSSPRSSPKTSPTTGRSRKCSRSHSGGSAKKVGRRSANGGSGNGRGATKGRRRKEGRTPLHYAAMNGQVDTARVLLEAGAPPAHRRNKDRESPLFAAAKNGHAGVVELLLAELGAGDVDAASSGEETPLSVACANGHADVVDQLVRAGADAARRDPTSHQSLLDIAVSIACPTSRARIVKALLAAEAENGDNRDGDGGGSGTEDGGHSTPLRAACRAVGLVGGSAVEALLEGGADADAAPPAGEGSRRRLRPLHVAAVHGNVEAVSALTLRGCCLDVKTMDPSRSTPLVLAVQQGHTEAARVLIEAGAAIDVVPRGEDGSARAPSLAGLAADMRRADLVSLLAKALIDRDSSETWAAEWAASSAASPLPPARGEGGGGETAAGRKRSGSGPEHEGPEGPLSLFGKSSGAARLVAATGVGGRDTEGREMAV